MVGGEKVSRTFVGEVVAHEGSLVGEMLPRGTDAVWTDITERYRLEGQGLKGNCLKDTGEKDIS